MAIPRGRAAPQTVLLRILLFRIEPEGFEVFNMPVYAAHGRADGMKLGNTFSRGAGAVVEISRIRFQRLPEDD